MSLRSVSNVLPTKRNHKTSLCT